MTQFNVGKQLLTVAEETMLVQLILESASQGFPLARNEIEQFANAILQARARAEETVGKSWFSVSWIVITTSFRLTGANHLTRNMLNP